MGAMYYRQVEATPGLGTSVTSKPHERRWLHSCYQHYTRNKTVLTNSLNRRFVVRSPPRDRETLWRFMPLFLADIELLLSESWRLEHWGSLDEG